MISKPLKGDRSTSGVNSLPVTLGPERARRVWPAWSWPPPQIAVVMHFCF